MPRPSAARTASIPTRSPSSASAGSPPSSSSKGCSRRSRSPGRLAATTPVQLVIAGDGPGRAAGAGGGGAGERGAPGARAVVLTGELRDPRPGVRGRRRLPRHGRLGAARDGVRAAAGRAGRARLLGAAHARHRGSLPLDGLVRRRRGPRARPRAARAILRGRCWPTAAPRDALGAYARRLVEDRFSLRAAAARQLDLYERALDEAPITPRRWLAPGGASASKLAAYRMRSRIDQVRGRLSADDFNARAVARIAPETPSRTAA